MIALASWSFVSDSMTSWTVACQVPLSMEFSRQEYWNELPFPSPGESSQPRDETLVSCNSCIAGRLFTTEPLGKPHLRWCNGKEFACQCKRCRFDPWVRKIPWRRKWQPTPVFLSGEFHGQRSLAGSNGISKIQTWSRDWAHIHTTLGKLIYYWIKRVTLG